MGLRAQEAPMPTRPIREIIRRHKLVTASESTTVAEAARLMNEARVGAILVLRKDRLVGIFTERDALTRVLAVGRDPVHTKLSQVMTARPDSMRRALCRSCSNCAVWRAANSRS